MTFRIGDKVYSKSMKQNLVIGQKEDYDTSICIDVSFGMPEAKRFGTYIVLNKDLEKGWKTPEELKLLRSMFLTDAERRRLEYLSKHQ